MKSRPLLVTSVFFAGAFGGAAYFLSHPKPPPAPQVEKSTAIESNALAPMTPPENSFAFATNSIITSPETALAIGEQWLAADPADDDRRASDLLVAMCSAKKFEIAIAFANQAPADLRDNWLELIFTRWAQENPRDAMSALASVSNSTARTLAFQTAADAWAANRPAKLAEFAASLPDGDDKTYALEKVVDDWSMQDPEAFATWLNTSPPVDLDLAIAEMISKTDSANRPPEIAAQWIEKISDPALKYNSLLSVMNQWEQNDPAAAENYLDNLSWLSDQQRREILEKIKTPPSDLAGGGE
ncbi:MAG TPA: hypothetical protein VFV23_01385 [Verrucomicrobiae bacterium]|nr:hypothetical protein [Verrucomicrobiae bacterium]